MRQLRWKFSNEQAREKRACYSIVSRVVDRNHCLQVDEKEHFRMFMRMQEKFSGCRVLAYCVMSNHFHILLEVPPMPVNPEAPGGEEGFTDGELLERLSALYSEAFVAEVRKELEAAREEGDEARVAEVHARFTYRMHDLSEFMKTLLQRFTSWFNRTHERTGTLWEQRYKSVIVESGDAARTVAAYIDLNPVRAGMAEDPAEYRWSSYGEAVGGGAKGDGKTAREGLVRACSERFQPDDPGQASLSNKEFAEKWKEVSRIYRRLMGLALGRRSGRANVGEASPGAGMNTEEMLASERNGTVLPDLGIVKMLRCRIRYFTDGAVIGSREFVNEAFEGARERFPEKRKDGARKLRGNAKAAAGTLWSMRDLRVRI